LATFLSLTVKAHVHIQSRIVSSESHNIGSLRQACRPFKMNWAFKVIRGSSLLVPAEIKNGLSS